MQRPKKLYSSSSEEEDDDDNYIPESKFGAKSAVQLKPPISSAPIIELRDQYLDVSRSEGEEEEDGIHLKPKLKPNKSPVRPNSSNVYSKPISQSNVFKKEVANAYTFKLKSPPTTSRKKKHDPVALFQKTNTAWKKDKFLTSRGNAKEGRKLELERRNRDVKTIAA